jgi:hypothetical protein
MPDYPDIYADGFSVTVGPGGCTLTLRLTQPTGEPGTHQDPGDIVGRVRMSPFIMRALAQALSQAAAATPEDPSGTETTIRH